MVRRTFPQDQAESIREYRLRSDAREVRSIRSLADRLPRKEIRSFRQFGETALTYVPNEAE